MQPIISLSPEDQSVLKELYDEVLSSSTQYDSSLSVIIDLEEQRNTLVKQLVFSSLISFPIETNTRTVR